MMLARLLGVEVEAGIEANDVSASDSRSSAPVDVGTGVSVSADGWRAGTGADGV